MNDVLSGNRLIAMMDSAASRAVLAQATAVSLSPGQILHEAGDPIDQVYFIEEGFASAVAALQDGRTVETLMIGREGAVGASAAFAPIVAATRAVTHVQVRARRIEAVRLRAMVAEVTSVRVVLGAYQAAIQTELERSVACNALHRAEQRLAKWLLRCDDRSEGCEFNLTQEHLASILGSQRTTVNEAAQGLQKSGAIAYSRGRISVRDRSALDRTACECYRAADAFRMTVPRG